MRLKEIYRKQGGLKVSFEVFPPKEGEAGHPSLLNELKYLKKYNPVLVSLTWGAGGNNNNSFELIETINNNFNLMPHFTCICNSRQDVACHLKSIEDFGVENILALRGDEPKDVKVCHTDFRYANELVEFIKSKADLAIAAAGYPEGHIEAPDIETDIINLKKKIDAGAETIYTQLFFNNDKFYKYLELVKKAGINVPVIPGIMPVLSMKQVKRMTSMAKISVPHDLMKNLEKFENSPCDMKNFGVEFAVSQCEDLIKNGVDALHFYTLNKAESVSKILDSIL